MVERYFISEIISSFNIKMICCRNDEFLMVVNMKFISSSNEMNFWILLCVLLSGYLV